ncbi:DUF4293 domain-containing protein [Aquimarina agarilytica]|uniref:DUF4293 domain-containing protein n=1 Tax=Aquimarina agarilytica TaxID=1087449 RepID=UPI000289AD8D|nr:DUF4293 domain-containing protein [Aquimarina agarilytica]
MIQRIQSVYLLLAALVSGVLSYFFPTGFDKVGEISAPFYYEMLLISALLSFIIIFVFKNRKLQFVLGRLNILLNVILLGVFVYLTLTVSGEVFASEKGIGRFIPVLSIVLIVLANKAIKKDEQLVKSVDRLR